MRKLGFLILFAGSAIASYYFFLPALLLMNAYKMDDGWGGHMIVNPPHVNPLIRLHGFLTGIITAFLGSCILFITHNKSVSIRKPLIQFTCFTVLSLAIGIAAWHQTQEALKPDKMGQQFYVFRDSIWPQKYGMAWPYSSSNNRNGRHTIRIVLSKTNHGVAWKHDAIWKTSEQLYQDWKYRVRVANDNDTATAEMFISENTSQWELHRTATTLDINYGNPP